MFIFQVRKYYLRDFSNDISICNHLVYQQTKNIHRYLTLSHCEFIETRERLRYSKFEDLNLSFAIITYHLL